MAAPSNLITLVVGPTASGKSQWALREALQSQGAIVNADSVQFYKHLQIGAAKPSAEDRGRVPHFLYDLVTPHETFTAGDFRRAALQVIEEQLLHRPLFFVGGSGFYIQALEKGMYDIGPSPASIIAQVAEFVKNEELFQELKKRDFAAAMRIGPSDSYRLQRALEIVLAHGKTISEIEAAFQNSRQLLKDKFQVRKVGLWCEREWLRGQVIKRTESMLNQGLIEEVENLLRMGFGGTKALSSVGYREVVAYLSGKLDRRSLQEAIVTSTMQLAKRQRTWFKRDQEIEWIKVDRGL